MTKDQDLLDKIDKLKEELAYLQAGVTKEKENGK